MGINMEFYVHLSNIPKSWALIWSWSPLCCYNSLHYYGKDFHLWRLLGGGRGGPFSSLKFIKIKVILF
jgi:hypothetical protein